MCKKDTTAPSGEDIFNSVDTVCTSLKYGDCFQRGLCGFHWHVSSFLSFYYSACLIQWFIKYYSQIKLKWLFKVHLPVPAYVHLQVNHNHVVSKAAKIQIYPSCLVGHTCFVSSSPGWSLSPIKAFFCDQRVRSAVQNCRTSPVTQLNLHSYRASVVALTCPLQKNTCSHLQWQQAPVGSWWFPEEVFNSWISTLFFLYALKSPHVLTGELYRHWIKQIFCWFASVTFICC